jgi:ferric-dicitrate binding protein FerR (iron transport regulator)
MDVNERTELFLTAAWSGQAVHLERGDVIVQAAKQRRGHLRVLTRDSIASVKGTVFGVSAGMGGAHHLRAAGSRDGDDKLRKVADGLRPRS